MVFPEELRESLKSHNIAAKDLNFNCVMLAFQVRDQHTKGQNVRELLTILKEEGMEIVQIENRYLEIEEAIYLKSRMMSQTENMILTSLGL